MNPRKARAMQSHGVFRCDGCGAEKRLKNPISGRAFVRLRNCYAYGHRACGRRSFEHAPNISYFHVTPPYPRNPQLSDYIGRA